MGDGMEGLTSGTSLTLRLFQCWFTADRGTFQQYSIADATRAIKVCTLSVIALSIALFIAFILFLL